MTRATVHARAVIRWVLLISGVCSLIAAAFLVVAFSGVLA